MLTKGIIYYTDNLLDQKIATAVQGQLSKVSIMKAIPIVCASLKKLNFGDKNIFFPHHQRGEVTMFRQILAGLENSTADIIFFAEHDVLYHPSHFDFTPPTDNCYYYNEHVWKTNIKDDYAIRHYCLQTSGLCAYRELLLAHYKKRIALCEKCAKDTIAQGLPVKQGGYFQSMGFATNFLFLAL